MAWKLDRSRNNQKVHHEIRESTTRLQANGSTPGSIPNGEVIRRDLAQIAELGADRIAYISPVDAAAALIELGLIPRHWQMFAVWSNSVEKAGLDVYVDVIQGTCRVSISLPSWLVSWHEGACSTDQSAIEAQSALTGAIYGTLSDMKAFAGLTFGQRECMAQFTDATHPRRIAGQCRADW